MKQALKKILPNNTIIFYRGITKWFRPVFSQNWFWGKRALRYSLINQDNDAILSSLLVSSHVLEKGITMPERRAGFGQSVARTVITLVNNAITRFPIERVEIQSSIADLWEYKLVSEASGSKLPEDIANGIEKLCQHLEEKYKIETHVTSFSELFKSTSSFPEFAASRHTCRNFSSKEVPIEDVVEAISIAQTAPSACNRQSTRVVIIDNPEVKKAVFDIQHGNRGFGHLANKILLVTSHHPAWEPTSFKDAHIDAGIFIMNLLYALHYKKIAACTLNASLTPENVEKLSALLNLGYEEIPVAFIAIGIPPEEFMIAKSTRVNLNDIYRVI